MKLNLASGRMYLKGYENVDDLSMNPQAVVDREADVFILKGYKRNSIEEILLCHFMMYVTPEEARTLFKRWYGWLKPKGKLIIETSDARVLAGWIVKNARKNMGQMFGYGATHGHRWSYTPSTLRELLKEAGFRKMKEVRGGLHGRKDRDFTIIAEK